MALLVLVPGLLLSGCPGKDPCAAGACEDMDGTGEADLAREADLSTGASDLGADLRGAAVDLAGAPDLTSSTGCSPNAPGPRGVAKFDLAVPVSTMLGGSVQTTVVGPSDDGTTLATVGAPFPLVLLSPGLSLPRGQFTAYGQRLASHGVIVVLQNARSELNHNQYRDDSKKVLDWMVAPTGANASKLMGRVKADALGVAGHSLGGKISILVAASDTRVKGLLGIDPVDGGFGPMALAEIGKVRLPAGTPIALLGETVSKMGSPACAPDGQNFEAFFGKAPAPAFTINFIGAAHNDFVDNQASCGQCGLCGKGTAPTLRTHDLAVKYTTAYFLWALRGETACADHLGGVEFDKDVMAGYVSRMSK